VGLDSIPTSPHVVMTGTYVIIEIENSMADVADVDKKITPGMILAHLDVIKALHFAIADNPENRKKFEDYMCQICSRVWCSGRCKATSRTMAQINLLTGFVTFRDEGSPELGIEGFDRVVTIGHAIRPFNDALADYFEEDGKQELHALICLAKKEGTSLGTLVVPKSYNIKKVLG